MRRKAQILSTGSYIFERIVTNAGAYDIHSACAGWVTALGQGVRY
jgi:3-oxoacyl-[acyl-carrier-protein] synthase III